MHIPAVDEAGCTESTSQSPALESTSVPSSELRAPFSDKQPPPPQPRVHSLAHTHCSISIFVSVLRRLDQTCRYPNSPAMECVSSIPLATCLAGPQNAAQEYGIGGLQNPWTLNSSHAAFWDCMSQWSFGKGTASSREHHFYLESPPISPRSRPTQVAASVPELSLEEEMDGTVTNAGPFEPPDNLEENGLVLGDERLSDHQGSPLSSPGIKTPGILQPKWFPLVRLL